MHSLSDAARAFAPHLPEDADLSADVLKRFDKGLRNLSQRAYLPASDRRGRVDLYDLPTLCALRLLIVAHEQGTTGDDLDGFARWMQMPDAKAAPDDQGQRPTPIAQAFARLSQGEAFDLEVSLFPGGARTYRFRWQTVTPEEARGADALALARDAGLTGPDTRTGVMTIFASKLMREAVDLLGALK